MEKKEKQSIIWITKYILDGLVPIGILVLIGLPFLIRYYVLFFAPEAKEQYGVVLVLVFLSGICGEWIVWELRKMMKTVVAKNSFVDENVRSLKIMGRLAFAISLIYFILIWIVFRPIVFLIIFTFFMAGLFSHVLEYVFYEAVRYKEENDLTV